MARFVMLDLFTEGVRDGKSPRDVIERVAFDVKIKYHEEIDKRRIFECTPICVNKNNIISMEEKEDLCPYLIRFSEDVWWGELQYKLVKEGGGYIKIPYTKIQLTNGKILNVKNSIREILEVNH